MSREGRKRRRSRKWTPAGAKPIPIRDLGNEHLANIHHMMETGEVRPGGKIDKLYQATPMFVEALQAEWGHDIQREIARRVVRSVQGR